MTSFFRNTLCIRAIHPCHHKKGDRQGFSLEEPLEYVSDSLGEITVPKGFFTDFASIPQAALWYIDDDDPAILYPSVVHDFLYAVGGHLPNGKRYTRAEADHVLREAMTVCGGRKSQIAVVHFAVSKFGSSHWKDATPSP